MTKIHQMFVLAATALALSTLPGRAGPCAQDIDRAWAKVDAKIHARIAAGRSAPQNVIGLLHHQPTLSSIAAAEKTLGQGGRQWRSRSPHWRGRAKQTKRATEAPAIRPLHRRNMQSNRQS